MSSFDLEEQEQIDALKAFWTKWGKLITAGITALCVGFICLKSWELHKKSQNETAAQYYAQLEKSVEAGQAKTVFSEADRLQNEYASTPWAARGALAAAAVALKEKNTAVAMARYQWVIAHPLDEGLVDIARLRLASVYLDQKHYKEALATLGTPRQTAFNGLYADLKGDILAAQGDRKGALEAYERALKEVGVRSPLVQLIELKKDSLADSAAVGEKK